MSAVSAHTFQHAVSAHTHCSCGFNAHISGTVSEHTFQARTHTDNFKQFFVEISQNLLNHDKKIQKNQKNFHKNTTKNN